MDDIENYLQNVQLPTLSEDQQILCEGLITLAESELTLQKMKPNKSPGEDGLPIEFYKTFWGEVGKFLIEMYNECLEKNELPLSMRKSIIALIFKKEDKTDISNYRPISLTNTDYRRLAFALSARVQKVIANL